MIIRPHHTPSRIATHQICTVEGRRDQINKCLQMLRRRFPPSRFPDLNLKPVLPPPVLPPSPVDPLGGPQPTPVRVSPPLHHVCPVVLQLSLPESVRCEAVLSAMVDAGHFFLQQPTHPSFASLERLDYYMLGIYSQTVGIPELPKPCDSKSRGSISPIVDCAFSGSPLCGDDSRPMASGSDRALLRATR
jgi:A-kinase anchor protein 1